MRKIAASLLVLGLLLAVLGCKRRDTPAQSGSSPSDNKPEGAGSPSAPRFGAAGKNGNGTFTVGKDTTYVTGPLDPDGFVDYPAARNERLKRGATPENNANVLIWKALGPRPEGAAMPPEYFQLMGVSAPPEQGEYFVWTDRYAREHPAAAGLNDQLGLAGQGPWTAQQYPHVFDWLLANERPLALIVEATTRTHYFNPLLPTVKDGRPSGLLGALLPAVQSCRGATAALLARAMLQAARRDPDKAWRDLLACHRLARLIGSGGTLIEGLVGMAIEQMACRVDVVLLDRGRLDVQRVATCLSDLQQLPALPDVATMVNLDGRFMFLDIMMNVNRQGIGFLDPGQRYGPPGAPDLLAGVGMADADWDPAYRNANRWFDRIAEMIRAEDRATRVSMLGALTEELRAMKARVTDRNEWPRLLGNGGRKEKGEVIGDVMISLMLPAFPRVMDAADRAEQTLMNTVTAFALAGYQKTNGRYPAALDVLAGPGYLGRAPRDLFSGKSPIYRPGPNGYLLYSVGVNGMDDGGRGYDADPPADDLAVVIPVPEPRR